MAEQRQAELERLAEAYFAAEMDHDPLAATLLGVPGHEHRVPDPSAQAIEVHRRTLTALGARLERVPLDGSPGEERVTRRVLEVLIRSSTDELRHGLADFAISAGVTAPQTQVFQSLAMTPVGRTGAGAYLERLAALPGYFDGWLDRYRTAAATGRPPLRSGVLAAIGQVDTVLAGDLATDPLIRPLTDHPESEQARALVRDRIRPALVRFRDGLAGLAEGARPDSEAGVCHVPGGAEGYADALARHTRPGLAAEDIHRVGLEAVAALREEFARLGERVLGIGDCDGVLTALRTDPALRFSRADEIVTLVEDALGRARAAVPDWFRPYGIADCVTREIGPLEADTAPLAYYQPPGPGGLPGTHWINTVRPATRFRYEYEALAFHESVPGHHLQLGLAATLTELPLFRRKAVGQLTAHMEGWGLYAERLADEMGLYSGDLDRLGMLSLDAVRACRLVVDTGMHHLGWSRERAVAYMRDNTATTEANVRNEIDRYLAWPGQATAYLIGRREIERQRARARAELGGRFSIRDFHHEVIGHGSLPLGVLDELISDWIETAA
ncbi:DUF885 domain-containing protein [Streptomyces sp. NPDC048290]|uniref:DUF885 domain-containing protein n=1 Tax=Streptomyces sp. NPDC048290 TaxID=3155811 RepID=UPI003426A48E